MVAVLTAALMTAAEISSMFSALGVIICFICMVVFILRINGEDVFGTSVVHMSQPPVAQVSFKKVAVPFTLELQRPTEATFSDVQLKIRSDVSYVFRSYWGVISDHVHSLMSGPWSGFYVDLVDNPRLDAEVVDEAVRCDASEEGECKKLALNENTSPVSLSLGCSPRKKYPLVVFMVRKDSTEDDDPSAVGALISIIHIKDAECQIPTCILHQYLKQYSGQITRLQALYTQKSKDEETSVGEKASRSRSEETDVGATRSSSEETDVGATRSKCEEADVGATRSKCEETDVGASKSRSEETDVGECTLRSTSDAPSETVDATIEETEEEEEIPIEEACVVCQTNRITRALLPCRHVCVCSSCFGRLETCPMCRARFLAYFLVAPETNPPMDDFHDSENGESSSVWQRICDSINNLLLMAH